MTVFNETPSVLIMQSACAGNAEIQLDVHPLWCELAVMPELDTTLQNHFTSQLQRFNPCGIDTVLLLQDIEPDIGYLMSLINCFTFMEDTKIPVVPFPSTFFFETPGHLVKHNDDRQTNTPKERSTRLEVVFDMTAVETLLLHHRVPENEEQPPAAPQPSASCNQEEETILRMLETLAEREARDLDRLLAALGAVFMILVAVYGWTAWGILKRRHKEQAKRSNRHVAFTHAPTSRPSNTDLPAERRSTKKEAPPPVDSVVFDRNRIDAPSLIEEPSTQPDQSAQVTTTYQKRFTKREPAATKQAPPLAVTKKEPPNFFKTVISKAAVPPRFSFTTSEVRTLSPCSRLAKEWEEKKGARRSKRRTTTRGGGGATPSLLLVPTAIVPPPPQQKIRKKPISPIDDDSKKNLAEDVAPLCPTSASEASFLNDYW